jgi:hypothetical protein
VHTTQITVHAVILADAVLCLLSSTARIPACIAGLVHKDLATTCRPYLHSCIRVTSVLHTHLAIPHPPPLLLLPAGFYISPSFLDKLSIHIAKNFMNLPKIKVPLILGIWGGKGQVRRTSDAPAAVLMIGLCSCC